MEKATRKIIILVLLLIASTTLTVGAQLGLFTFVDNLTSIIEVDRRVPVPFVLENLPEFFEASVVVEGSGYTGQPHTVEITIGHNRPDSSKWLAQGTYSLDLEIIAGTSKEEITSGFFTDLRNTAPHIVPPHSWIPTSPNGSYEMVLNIRNIIWTILIEHTITASASAGGIISPWGTVVVTEGSNQDFSFIAEVGYELSDVLVDNVTKGAISGYVFTNVQADHTIEARFEKNSAIYDTSRVTIASSLFNLQSTTFDNLTTKMYLTGETVNLDIMSEYYNPLEEILLPIGSGNATYSTKYLSGESSVLLDPATTDGDAGRIWIPVDSIPFQDFNEPTFMIWEPTGASMGGSYDTATDSPEIGGDGQYPYGHPYVNINLDLNGDGTYPTYGDDKLEAIGSSAGGATVNGDGFRAVAPTAETWTEMQEAWGYHDGDNSIDNASTTPSSFSGMWVVHTFADWKTYMATAHPNATVIGIEVTFGFWSASVSNFVYVDDVVTNGIVNHLEDGVAGATYNVSARPVGGSWVEVITGGIETFTPAIQQNGILHITDSFTQPAGTSGDWEIELTITGLP